MARPTTQQLRAAVILVVVVVVAMAATATATGPGHRRAPSPPPSRNMVYCNSAVPVLAGDTCEKVARDYRITLQEFMAYNPNLSCRALFVGQWVCVRGVVPER